MPFDTKQIREQVIKLLLSWDQHKRNHQPDKPNTPGLSPLSETTFVGHHWREYLPGLGDDLPDGPGGYQYLKDQYFEKATEFERAVKGVFQEVQQQNVITIAAPYERPAGTTAYGTTLGGTQTFHYELTARASEFAHLDTEGIIAVLTLPTGLQNLAKKVEQFISGQGPYQKIVFLMMPFGTDPVLAAAQIKLKELLRVKGFNLFRADDREYEDGLWENICVYMLGCKHGLAVFKEIVAIQFNPNVAVEIGFMAATGKRVLILKDRTLPKLPGDLLYRLYHAVDFSDVAELERHVSKWFDELDD
jgi:hypothetical protein